MAGVLLLQRLKEQVQGGLEVVAVLPGPAVLDHIHDHFKVLLLRGRFMEQVEDEGGVQGNFAFLPKRVVVAGVLGGGVADQVMHQLHGVLVVPDVGEGVKGVGVGRVDQVKNLDDIAPLNEQRSHGPQHFSLGVCHQKTAIRLHQIRLAEKAGLASAGAADYNLQEIPPVDLSIEAHADILRKQGILHGVFVTVLGIELLRVPPFGGAVFLAGPSVFLGGEKERQGEPIDNQRQKHKFQGMRSPSDREGALHQNGEAPQQLNHIHSVLVAIGQDRSHPKNGNGQ